MIKDDWRTVSEALAILGPEWSHDPSTSRLVKLNEHGVVLSSKRVFDGTEHPLAQKGKVIMNSGPK